MFKHRNVFPDIKGKLNTILNSTEEEQGLYEVEQIKKAGEKIDPEKSYKKLKLYCKLLY